MTGKWKILTAFSGLVGAIFVLSYVGITNGGAGDHKVAPSLSPQANGRERVRQPDHKSQNLLDTEFMTKSGSVDRAKLGLLFKNVDARTFSELYRRIHASPLNDQDRCNYLFGLSLRMVKAGEAELAWTLFDEIKPTGELRERLLMALFQDPTKSVASLIKDQRKFSYDDESKAALVGITEKMRRTDFNQAELLNLPRLNSRESLAIANGIAMGYGNVEGDEAKAVVFKNGLDLIGKLIDQGILEEEARTCFIGSSSMLVPFETWDTLVSRQAKGTEAQQKMLEQAMGMNAVGLIKMNPEAGMSLLASSFSEGRIDESVLRTGIREWIRKDIEMASKWIVRNSANQDVADVAYVEMYKRCMGAGDRAAAEQWHRMVKNPAAIQDSSSNGSGATKK